MAVSTRMINDEDIVAAEQVEAMLGRLGRPPRDLLLRADRNAVEGRRMLQAMMDRERGLEPGVPAPSGPMQPA